MNLIANTKSAFYSLYDVRMKCIETYHDQPEYFPSYSDVLHPEKAAYSTPFIYYCCYCFSSLIWKYYSFIDL